MGRQGPELIAAYVLEDGEWWEDDATTEELRQAAAVAKARETVGPVPWPGLRVALARVPADSIAAACQVSKTRATHVRHGHALLTRDERDQLVRRRLVKAEAVRGFVKGESR